MAAAAAFVGVLWARWPKSEVWSPRHAVAAIAALVLVLTWNGAASACTTRVDLLGQLGSAAICVALLLLAAQLDRTLPKSGRRLPGTPARTY